MLAQTPQNPLPQLKQVQKFDLSHYSPPPPPKPSGQITYSPPPNHGKHTIMGGYNFMCVCVCGGGGAIMGKTQKNTEIGPTALLFPF